LPSTRVHLTTILALTLTLATSARSAHDLPGLDIAAQCLTAPYTHAVTPAAQRLRALLDRLDDARDPLQDLAADLTETEPLLCIDDRPIAERGYFDVDQNLIAVSAALDPDEMLTILIHELHHVVQYSRGYCPSNDVSREENARATFAVEADAMAITALAAWVLRSQGDPGPWSAMLGWDRYADIAERFDAEASASGNLARAASLAFYQWYDSDWRRTSYYLSSCSDYLDRQDRTHALPSYDLLPSDFLTNLCRLPDGTRYNCAAP